MLLNEMGFFNALRSARCFLLATGSPKVFDKSSYVRLVRELMRLATAPADRKQFHEFKLAKPSKPLLSMEVAVRAGDRNWNVIEAGIVVKHGADPFG